MRYVVWMEDIPFQFCVDDKSGYKIIRPADMKDEPYLWQA